VEDISMNASSESPFTLTSPAFKDNGVLDRKYGGSLPGNQNCLGENISPALAWRNPPVGTKSYALLMFDPEGRKGLGVVHLVAYGIPLTARSLPEGALSKASNYFVSGTNEVGDLGYIGPCAPPGAWHHYAFTLIATDLPANALSPGLTANQLRESLEGHALLGAGIVARYRHPDSQN
jgi:Raf kinase inhibitor-like YbhB/YbcL family protein